MAGHGPARQGKARYVLYFRSISGECKKMINKLKLNPDNPRTISKERFESLKKSIREFPEMMEKRPIIYDENNIVLGGNMRLRALKELEKEGFEIKDSYFLSAKGS